MQEVLTPELILGPVRAALGGSIEFDPCASTDPKNWFAKENRCLPPRAGVLQALESPTKEQKAELKALVRGGSLVEAWPKVTTFINPHFDTLEPWMRRLSETRMPTIMLCPVRPHRKWWIAYATGLWVSFLRPFPFVGSKSSFPAPLCLIAANCSLPFIHGLTTGKVKI